MTHIRIRFTSPSPTGGKQIHESIQIKTSEGFLPLAETAQSTATGEVEPAVGKRAARSMKDADEQVEAQGEVSRRSLLQDGPSAEGLGVFSNVVTEVKEEKYEVQENTLYQSSDGTSRREHSDNAEIFLPRREMASFKAQLDAFKTKLEEEVIERFKIEDELKSEKEIYEFETRSLHERIEELVKSLLEKNLKLETLENWIEEYKKEQESARQENECLQSVLAKSKVEISKLRSQVIAANDQTEEFMGEVESLRERAKQNALEKDRMKKRLRDEIEENGKEIRGLKDSLEEKERINEEKDKKIQSLGKDASLYKEQVEELREELTKASNRSNADQESLKILRDSSKSEQLLELSNELNDVYREYLETQSKVSVLTDALNSAQREIEDARNCEEKHSLELQNFKEKYAELKDLSTALREENRHLKNTSQKRSKDSRETKKKFLILETEVMWLREALNIVGISKPDTLKGVPNVDQIDTRGTLS